MKRALVAAALACVLFGCGDEADGDAGSGAGSPASANSAAASGASSSGAGSTGSTVSASSASSSSSSGGLPAYASFHLNYTQDIDFSKCAERDFVVLDMAETPAASIARCESMGARLLCYLSSQYEEWRDDASSFGALEGPLDGWPGEFWVDPNDPQNLAVLVARLDVAVEKGCDGIDLDNIDRDGHEAYIQAIFDEARARGLLVSQKKAIEKIELFWDKVDLYQNEECQAYDECQAYEGLGRPVHNIEYEPCQTIPYLYSHRKDVQAMDAWEEPCAP